MKIYDAIIIGAGPAGSSLAHLMSKNGREVLVLDRSREIKRKVCGEYLCPLGVEELNKMNLSFIADKFPKLSGMKIYTPKATEVDTDFPEERFGISVNRQFFDQALFDVALSTGAQIKLGKTITKIVCQGNYWQVWTSDDESYCGRLLVGADGRNSFVAKSVGLTIPAKSKRIAIHSWVKIDRPLRRKGQMHIFDDGSYIGLDPIGDEELNISLVCNPEVVKEHGNTRKTFEYYLKKLSNNGVKVTLSPDTQIHSSFPIEHRVSDIIGHNLALIGDAAGFVDPITGEGIFNALRTANLLWEALEADTSLLSFTNALMNYRSAKMREFQQKSVLNNGFQWLIKHARLIEFIAKFLNKSKQRRDAFIGIIGNIYSPLQGLKKILFF